MAAPKGNKYAEGNEGGAPTLYKKEYNEQAFNYCLLGATDKQLGDFFNVTEQTINNWKKEHEEFFESIRAGKEIADIQVAKSLYQNCLGAILTKEKEVKVKKIDPETSKIIEGVEVVTLQEQLPPDTNAIKFWLTNRQSENWKIKKEVDTKVEDVTDKIDYTKLDNETLQKIKKARINKDNE